MRIPSRLIVALALLATPALAQRDADLDALLADVTRIAKPGVPGPVVVHGQRAFAVATAQQGGQRVAVVAAARAGEGRVVAIGHPGYLGADALAQHDTWQLVRNAVRWAATARPKTRVACLEARGFAERAAREPWTCTTLGRDVSAALVDIDVVVTDSGRPLDPAAADVLREFVEAGGGLVVAGLGWGWQQLNPKRRLAEDHPWHALLVPWGLAFGDGTVSAIDPVAPVDPDALRRLNAAQAVAALRAGPRDAHAAELCATIERALRALPDRGATLRSSIDALVADHGPVTISADQPLEDPFERLVASVRHAARDEGASPLADDFPGPVPADAPRVAIELSLDLETPGWASTGAYAAPGETIAVTVPAKWTGLGLALRIGCHTDRLWHKPRWQRFPEISVARAIGRETTRLANPFGGLVYLAVPRRLEGNGAVRIDNAVRAPWFVRGATELDAWRGELRAAPAPWAELQGRNVVLSVPAAAARELDDPQELLEFWDRVLDDYADLGARRLPARPERIVTDRQISAGYMHSGYPIMMHVDVQRTLLDVEAMRHGRHGGVWGFWHELGHNHQRPEWTFAGTTEVTCNLFSLFVQERLGGIEPIDSPRLAGPKKKLAAFLADGAPFDRWQREPFLALLMYAQIQDAFGWDAFRETFAGYRTAPRGELPRSDADKRDQWLVRLSRAVGRDLGPFFERWGVPTSDAARDSIRELPAWLPE